VFKGLILPFHNFNSFFCLILSLFRVLLCLPRYPFLFVSPHQNSVFFSSSPGRPLKRHMACRFSLVFFDIRIFVEECRSWNSRITDKIRGSVCSYRCRHLYIFWKHVWRRSKRFNPLKAELNPICHLLALLRARHILHISRIRVK